MTVIPSGRVRGREPRDPREASAHPRRESAEDREEWEKEEDKLQKGLFHRPGKFSKKFRLFVKVYYFVIPAKAEIQNFI